MLQTVCERNRTCLIEKVLHSGVNWAYGPMQSVSFICFVQMLPRIRESNIACLIENKCLICFGFGKCCQVYLRETEHAQLKKVLYSEENCV